MFHALKKFFNKHGHYGLIRNRKVEEEFCSANPYSFGDDVIPPVDINLIPVSMGINKWLKTENQQQLSSCFLAGTKVTMADGTLKNIDDLTLNEEVLSHTQCSRKITNLMNREYSGTLYTFFIKGWGKITMTNDHVVLVVRDEVEKWVKAEEVLSTDKFILSPGVQESKLEEIDLANYITCPVSEVDGRLFSPGSNYSVPRYLKLDELTCFILGLYVAEGSSSYSKLGYPQRANWTLNIKEEEYYDKIKKWGERIGLFVSKDDKEEANSTNVRISSCVIASFLSNVCGRFANHKEVPHFIMSGSKEQKLAFLHGYFDGDGSDTKIISGRIAKSGNLVKANQISAGTASKVLAQEISTLFLSLGMKPGRSVSKQADHQNHVSNQVYLYSNDAKSFFDGSPINSTRATWCKFGQTRPIREITKLEVQNCQVYDITVDKDHSFVAEGVIVHNCVGHGSTSAAEIAFYRETRLVEQFNRMFAYRTAQMIDGITGDRGAMITGAGKASMKFGHCLESIWPYVNRYQTKLPAECFKDAEKRKIRMYKALRSYDDVLRWLVHGIGGVHIGIDWNSSMDNYDSKGRITKYSQGGGGHALCLGDWNKEFLDDKGQPFIEMFNSWGVNWGVGGRAYIHPKVVDYWCKAEVVIGYSDMDGEAVKPRTYDWSTFSM